MINQKEQKIEDYNNFYSGLNAEDKKFCDLYYPSPADSEKRGDLLQEAQIKVARARQAVMFNKPWFGDLLFNLNDKFIWPENWDEFFHFNATSIPNKTICVTDKNYYFNPVWVLSIDIKELCAHIMNLVLKPALLHWHRAGGRIIEKWNTASNSVTSDIIQDSLQTAPESIKQDFLQKFQGKACEFIYENLPDPPKESKKPKGGSTGGPGSLSDILSNSTGGMVCPQDSSQMEESASRWLQRLVNATESAKLTRGYIPAGIEVLIDSLLESKIPWWRYLSNFLSSAISREEYSSNRYNKNYMHMNIMIPALHQETSSGVFIIDTSGSCWGYLQRFMSEVQGILGLHGMVDKVHIITCDAVADHVQDWEINNRPPELKMTGGGGTSFVPPFELIREKGWTPDFVVYLTDMYGDFPDRDLDPGCPVLWASVTPLDGVEENVKFGNVCHVEISDCD